MKQITDLCPRPAKLMEAGKHGAVNVYQRLPAELERALPKQMDALSKLYEQKTGTGIDLNKLPKPRQRLLSVLCEQVKAHHLRCMETRMFHVLGAGQVFEGQRRRLMEATGTADIAAYTTQQLVMVVDVVAQMDWSWMTTIPMTGPTAFIHRMTWTREEASDFYDAGSALVEGLDPSYTECPTECSAANGVDLEVTSETIEVDCRRLKGNVCIPANYFFGAQYDGDLVANVMQGILRELPRTTLADLLTTLLANAGNTINSWSRTPAQGSYFESANPNEWRRELWNTLNQARRNIMADPQGRVVARHVLGDIAGVGILEDAVPREFRQGADGDQVMAAGDVRSQFFDTLRVGDWTVHRVIEGLPEDTLVVLDRTDSDPTFVYGPFLPATALQQLTDPENAEIKVGAITLYGQAAVRPGRIEEIAIGA